MRTAAPQTQTMMMIVFTGMSSLDTEQQSQLDITSHLHFKPSTLQSNSQHQQKPPSHAELAKYYPQCTDANIFTDEWSNVCTVLSSSVKQY